MLRNPEAEGKDYAYTVVSRGEQLGKAIRTTRWRYATWPAGEELYDLTNDPAEETNLALVKKHAADVKKLRIQLAAIDKAVSHPPGVSTE